MLFAAV